MKNHLILVFLFLPSLLSIQASERKAFEIPRTEVVSIQDTQSDRQYELYIKLPKGYSEKKDAEYPVIYFTDAVWHMEILSASTEFLLEDVILVGISWQKNIDAKLKEEVGEYVSRFRDYTVIKSSNAEHQAKYQFGQASQHLAFIRNDVFKYVESNYQTDPSNRTYFGYSAGGLFGAYVLLSAPDTFKNYLLGSPSVQGDMTYLTELNSDAQLKSVNLNANVFISHGSLEKELSSHIEEYISLLKNRKDTSLSLRQVVIEGSHQTGFPMTGVRAVTWLSHLIKDKD
ncbi:alpha/beta hydrolase [Marinicella sp. W31]|uniref:alpha/beta hydrolase n=1 Tax=Marinicella sp. W31 TaxID=3023713 RepID=UPI0037573C57